MIRFKNVGTIDISITANERSKGVYDVPVLVNGSVIKPKLLPPTHAALDLLRLRAIPDEKLRGRSAKPMVKEPYVLVDIVEHPFLVYPSDDLRRTPQQYMYWVYYFVKKRNYKKYIFQTLSDDHKIDYVVARWQQEFDKALSLGFVEVI